MAAARAACWRRRNPTWRRRCCCCPTRCIPPDKPAQLRTAHFPSLGTRAVFVHGTADPFATIAELEAAVAAIPAATRFIPVPGPGTTSSAAASLSAEAVAALLESRAKQRVKQ